MNDQLNFNGSQVQADSLNNHPRIKMMAYIDTTTEPGRVPTRVAHIGFGNLIHPVLHNSAWESAKATGALNFMPYEKVLSLSSLYNPQRITDELLAIKQMLSKANEITSKKELTLLLSRLNESHTIIQTELQQYDLFVNMLEQID